MQADREFYKVIVDEGSGLIKYIKKRDSNFLFEPWEKHVLKTSSVDLMKNNPIRAKSA